MNTEFFSGTIGLLFSLLHIALVLFFLRFLKKRSPVFLHALSAILNLTVLCFFSYKFNLHIWVAVSILAVTASALLFAFGTVYKSIMIRLLCRIRSFKGEASINQINDEIVAPTFENRAALLVQMGYVDENKGHYALTLKGKKIIRWINFFRSFFKIGTSAMYKSELKKPLWKKQFQLNLKVKHLVIIIYALLILTFVSGLYQKLYKSADNRIKYHAIPVAISTLYQGHKHDYRGWLSTEIPFQGVEGVLKSGFIKRQLKEPVYKERGHYHWVADDRGFCDFVIGAFALFGPRMMSLYHFWFLVLFVSVTLFILAFRKHSWALIYLAFIVLGLHSAMSLLKLMHVAVPIYEPRYLDVLAIVPIIHIIFVAAFVEKNDFLKHLGPLLGQVAIFTSLYHCRSSLGWQIVVVSLLALVCIVRVKTWDKIKVPLWTAGLLLISCTLLLSSYKHLTYHPSYFKDMGARTFWHNALMGLGSKTFPKLEACDHTIAKLVIEYAQQKGCSEKLSKMSAQDLLNSLGNWGTADWKEYERWAKKYYFSLVTKRVSKTAYLYLVFKPSKVIRHIISPRTILFVDEKTTQTLKNAIPWNPLNLIYLIPVLLLAYGFRDSLFIHQKMLLLISSSIFICGMIPSVVFYSDILTRGGMSVIQGVILYYLMIQSLSYFYTRIKKYFYRARVNELG